MNTSSRVGSSNNAINTGRQKRRSALLLPAGYGERYV
jgi:hypothetical protein